MSPAQNLRAKGWRIAAPALVATVAVGFYLHRQIHAGFGPGLILDLPLIALFAVAWLVGVGAWRYGFRWFFRRQRIGLYLGVILGICSLVVLFYTEEAWRGKRAWQNASHEMALKGESFALASIIPPEVPDDQNFVAAPVFSALFDSEPTLWGPAGKVRFRNPAPLSQLRGIQLPLLQRPYCKRWFQGEFVDLALWQDYFRSNGLALEVFRAEPAYDVIRALSRYDRLLNQLRTASRRPGSRFPVQYEKGLLAENPQIRVLRDLSHVLCLRSVAELALGKSTEALDEVRLSFRLAEALRNEPGFFPRYTRQEILVESLQPVWEGLALRRWSEPQLKALQDELSRIDLLADFDEAWRSEMVLWVDLGNKVLAAKTSTRGNPRDMSALPASAEAWLHAYPSGWVYQNQAALYRFYKDLTATVDPVLQRVQVPAADAAHRRLRQEYFANDPAFCIVCLPKLNQMCASGVPHSAFTQTAINQAILACGLERYRLENGAFPEELIVLMPRYAARLPQDVVSGLPLKYRRLGQDRFELYSVGWNGTDEGGRPGPAYFDQQNRNELWRTLFEGDWAWCYPAGTDG
jgi:hypothetical protein